MMTDVEITYRPLELRVRQKLLPLCLADQLFCVMYDALEAAAPETGLAPEEAWCEASAVAARLGGSPRPDIAIRQEQSVLVQRYASLDHPESALCAVFTVLLHMLASASRNMDDNPNRVLCVEVARRIMEHPLYGAMCRTVRQSESVEEGRGRFVLSHPRNYLEAPSLSPEMQETEGSIDVEELVEVALETCSASLCESVLSVLSAYNDRHGHRIQPHVTHLREGLNELRRKAAETRRIENNGTYNEHVGQQNVGLLSATSVSGQNKFIDN